jgi:predicted permease
MIVWVNEIRLAARQLMHSPLLLVLVTASIGLAVGGNAIVFSWLESTVLNPYPAVASPDRLVALNMRAPDGRDWPLSYPAYKDWRDTDVFAGVAAWSMARLSRRGEAGAPASEAWAMLVSSNYFEVLGVRVSPGRPFTAEDEARANPVAVLTHGYWVREFGGDADIVGRSLNLNGTELQIVGVAPDGFVGTYVGAGFDVFVPLTLQPRLQGASALDARGARWLQSFARLWPKASLASSRQAFEASARAASESAGEVPVTGALVRRMREQFLGSLVFPLFTAMLVVTVLVLLIACANVMNLLMARAVARRAETAVRLSLGADARHVSAPFLAESVLLALPGLLAGLALAYAGKGLIHRFIPPVALRVELPIHMNARVIVMAAVATALTAVLAGLAPSLLAARTRPMNVLRLAGDGGGKSRLRDGLVVAQIALAVAAVFCATLFVRSLDRARAVEPGFDSPATVLLAGTDMSVAEADPDAARVRVERLLDRLRAIPGVAHVAASTMVPLGFGGHRYADVRAQDYVPAPDQNSSAERVVVSAGYFETMGMNIVRGRGFRGEDRVGSRPVAVVNEAFARRFWPGLDALGRALDQGQATAIVVGVARDGKYRDLDDSEYPVVYWPLAQVYESRFTLHVRALAEPAALWRSIRQAFANESADLPLLAPRTLAEHMRAATLVQEIGGAVLGIFGALALVMAAIGVYGTLVLNVNARRKELGLRLALGAPRRHVIALVLARSGSLALAGGLAGLPIAAAAGFLLQPQLIGVTAMDVRAVASVLLSLTALAGVAGAVPALRAVHTDPIRTLKS